MFLKDLIQSQKPLTVSIVSFLSMSLVVVVIGLFGGKHIIDYLQGQLVRHGISHNLEVVEGMQPLLERSLQEGVPADIVIENFQAFIEHAGPFGARLFLIDRATDRVIADSEAAGRLPYPVAWLLDGPVRRMDGREIPELGRWSGSAWHESGSGEVELLTLRKLSTAGQGRPAWTLGVGSNLSELLAFMDELHLHLDVVLLITQGLIGLLGFLVLRWVGRRYEFSLEQQVVARTRELEQAHARLLDQARLATIGQTASVLAHEMRNPLASIKLALSGVSRGEGLSARQRQRVDLVVGEVDRLEALLSQTLDYARPIVADKQLLALDALLDKVLALEAESLAEKRLRLVRETCPQCPPLPLDAEKMQQALLNLLKNAREASPEQGEIRISLRADDTRVRLILTNPGEALDDAVLEHACDFFFTTKSRGTGLGLGLVKRVVEAHGGQILLRSADGLISVELLLPIPARGA